MSAERRGTRRPRPAATDTAGTAGTADAPEVSGTAGAGALQWMRPVAERLGLTSAQEVAVRAVNRAAANAKARGFAPGRPVGRQQIIPELRSGARRDARDPVLLGEVVERFFGERGWEPQLSVGGLTSRWAEVVGANLGEHSEVVGFDDGVLVIRASSTAWATELQFQVPYMLRRLEEDLGADLVRSITVLGPGGQSWVHGRRSVRGRGVRDTYG